MDGPKLALHISKHTTYKPIQPPSLRAARSYLLEPLALPATHKYPSPSHSALFHFFHSYNHPPSESASIFSSTHFQPRNPSNPSIAMARTKQTARKYHITLIPSLFLMLSVSLHRQRRRRRRRRVSTSVWQLAASQQPHSSTTVTPC